MSALSVQSARARSIVPIPLNRGFKEMISGFKAMAAYLEEHGNIKMHPDVLRKAVSDDRNPLRVEWENGRAYISPLKLMEWRERRKGIVRRDRRVRKSA